MGGGGADPKVGPTIKTCRVQSIFFLISSANIWGLCVSVEYCRSGNIREVLIFANFAKRTNENPAKIIIIIALLKKNENSRILNIVNSSKVGKSQKFKHAKITRSTVPIFCVSNSYMSAYVKAISLWSRIQCHDLRLYLSRWCHRLQKTSKKGGVYTLDYHPQTRDVHPMCFNVGLAS